MCIRDSNIASGVRNLKTALGPKNGLRPPSSGSEGPPTKAQNAQITDKHVCDGSGSRAEALKHDKMRYSALKR
eukprot:4484964-Alexandrium_andersonii.AAC.1